MKLKSKSKVILTVLLIFAMLAGSLTAVFAAVKKDSKSSGTAKTKLTKTAKTVSGANKTTSDGSGVSKEETVYVKADANGYTKNVTVSDWLKNAGSETSLSDASNLTNIENVKGDEKFTQNGSNLTWKTDGKDIYYRGKSNESLPLTVGITYKLNGNTVTPKEIAGKSGKVEIDVFYNNNSKTNGINTPFTVATAMDLPVKHFTNVKIDHGTVINDGSNNMVVGIAFPGLTDTLGLSGNKDIEIPETLKITADAKKFDLGLTLTSASTDVLNRAGLKDVDSFDDLDSAITQLEDASSQLVAGSLTAKTGAVKLATGASALQQGVSQYTAGVKSAANGSKQLANGSKTLQNGTKQYTAGVKSAKAGSDKLAAGTKQYTDGVKSAANGSKTLSNSVNASQSSFGELSKGINDYTNGVSSVSNGLNSLQKNMSALSEGSQKLNTGVGQLNTTITNLNTQINSNINLLKGDIKNKSGITVSSPSKENQQSALSALVSDLTIKATTYATISENPSATNEEKNNAYNSYTTVLNNYATVAGDFGAWTSLVEIQSKLANTTTQSELKALSDGVKQIAAGIGTKNDSASKQGDNPTVYGAVNDLANGANQLTKNNKDLQNGGSALVAGGKQLSDGTKTLSGGLNTLNNNSASLNSGASQLASGLGQLNNNSATLNNGVSQLVAGTNQLTTGLNLLNSNSAALNSGAGQLVSGTNQLSSGLGTLASGMSQFKSEGIDKIADVYNNDIKGLTSKLDTIKKASKDYNNFSGIANGMKGSVNFIIETGEVSK